MPHTDHAYKCTKVGNKNHTEKTGTEETRAKRLTRRCYGYDSVATTRVTSLCRYG